MVRKRKIKSEEAVLVIDMATRAEGGKPKRQKLSFSGSGKKAIEQQSRIKMLKLSPEKKSILVAGSSDVKKTSAEVEENSSIDQKKMLKEKSKKKMKRALDTELKETSTADRKKKQKRTNNKKKSFEDKKEKLKQMSSNFQTVGNLNNTLSPEKKSIVSETSNVEKTSARDKKSSSSKDKKKMLKQTTSAKKKKQLKQASTAELKPTPARKKQSDKKKKLDHHSKFQHMIEGSDVEKTSAEVGENSSIDKKRMLKQTSAKKMKKLKQSSTAEMKPTTANKKQTNTDKKKSSKHKKIAGLKQLRTLRSSNVEKHSQNFSAENSLHTEKGSPNMKESQHVDQEIDSSAAVSDQRMLEDELASVKVKKSEGAETSVHTEKGSPNMKESQHVDQEIDSSDQRMLEDELDSVKVKKYGGPLVFDAVPHAVLVLEHPDEVCIKGKVQVKCLCGSVSILGYILTPEMSYHNVYSPSSSSLLTLKTVSGEKRKSTILKKTKDILSSECQAKLLALKQDVVLLKLKILDTSSLDYIMSIPPFTFIFSPFFTESVKEIECNTILSCLGVKILEEEDFKPLQISEDFLYVADKVKHMVDNRDTNPTILVCGGKNTGKSTMNRFLINTLLNSMDKVFYMECDIGQTEFTPPGCISLQCVEKPILGPPFCHQWKPVHSSYFGGVSAADDPDFYIECIRDVYKTYMEITPRGPLIVNTMGWNKGLGVLLLIDTVQITRPSMVIQIDSYSQYLNFPSVTPSFITSNPGWIYNSKIFPAIGQRADLQETTHTEHELIVVDSLVENRLILRYTKVLPADHRNLSLISYLAQKIEYGMTLSSLTPHTVSWDSVAVCASHASVPDSQILYAMNASVVALCRADLSKTCRDHEGLPRIFKKIPLCKCLGFGLIRGIDPEKKLFYVTTPLSLNALQKVNTLIRGATKIPEKILLKQECDTDILPYVSQIISGANNWCMGSCTLKRRQHMPRKFF